MEDRQDSREDAAQVPPEPAEERRPRGVVATFREAFRRVKEGQDRSAPSKPAADPLVSERAARNRDRSKTLLVMVGGIVFVLIVFLGLFSSSHSDNQRDQAARRGSPSLGRPGNDVAAQGRRPGSVTPLLNADPSGQEGPSDQLTPEDISGTSRPKTAGDTGGPTPVGSRGRPSPYPSNGNALSDVPFTDPALEAYRQQLQVSAAAPPPPSQPAPSSQTPPQPPTPATPESEALAKSSLVYVRTAATNSPANGPGPAAASTLDPALSERSEWVGLPAGTRLIARLQTAVSTAVKAPVIAVVEAHYERDGEIVVPAGTKAIGDLQSAGRSGFVGIRFHTLQMPDGTTEKIDAGAMSLSFEPLKGQVNGTSRGKQFLARALTGVGTVAAFAVGGSGLALSGPMDNSILLRERVSQNIGNAGDQELQNLAYSQDVVVTVPGNTRFFLVFQQGVGRDGAKPGLAPASNRPAASALAASTQRTELPSAAELRELLQLKRELNRIYGEGAAATTTAQTVR
jgi:hypothetical protein